MSRYWLILNRNIQHPTKSVRFSNHHGVGKTRAAVDVFYLSDLAGIRLIKANALTCFRESFALYQMHIQEQLGHIGILANCDLGFWKIKRAITEVILRPGRNRYVRRIDGRSITSKRTSSAFT